MGLAKTRKSYKICKTANYSDVDEKNLHQNYHVVKGAKIYSILILNIFNKPTSNIYLEKLFENTTLDWSKIYLLPRLATNDTILKPQKKPCTFVVPNAVFSSFCKALEETPIHIFYDCIRVKSLWERLQTKFQNDIILPSLTPQAAILGLTNEANTISNLLNHILLAFKCYVYRSREKRILIIDTLIDNLIEIKKKEKTNNPC